MKYLTFECDKLIIIYYINMSIIFSKLINVVYSSVDVLGEFCRLFL